MSKNPKEAPEVAPQAQNELGRIIQFHVREGILRGAKNSNLFTTIKPGSVIGNTSKLVCDRIEWHAVGVKVVVKEDVFVVPFERIDAIDLEA